MAKSRAEYVPGVLLAILGGLVHRHERHGLHYGDGCQFLVGALPVPMLALL